jgi:hypothetical protein
MRLNLGDYSFLALMGKACSILLPIKKKIVCLEGSSLSDGNRLRILTVTSGYSMALHHKQIIHGE